MKLNGFIDAQFREYPLLSMLIWTLVGLLATYCISLLLHWDTVATLVRTNFLLLTLTIVATGYPSAKVRSFRKSNGSVSAFTLSQNKAMLATYGGCIVCLFLLTLLQVHLASI